LPYQETVISMSFLKGPRNYAFINARVRGIRSKMLTISQYEKLIQASDLDEAVRLLSATPYWDELSKVLSQPPIDMEEVDAMLRQIYAKEVKSLAKSLPKKVSEFVLKYLKGAYYYSNIKTIIKIINSGEPRDHIRKHLVALTLEEGEEYDHLLAAQNVPQLVDRIPDPRLRRRLQEALQKYEATGSTMPFEAELNKYFFHDEIWKAIRNYLDRTDQKYAREFFGLRIDLTNIMTVIRAKLQGIEPQIIEDLLIPVTHRATLIARSLLAVRNIEEALNMLTTTPYRELAHRIKEAYEKSPTITSVEHAFEEYSIQTTYLSVIGYPFHIGTVLAYLDLKYYELRNIKIILVGKSEGVNPATIRELIVITP